MKFLVYTPFRCGSSFITFLLKKNTNYPIYFCNNHSLYDYKEKLIVKCHNCENNDKIRHHDFDYVFTSIRKPTDIFISSYFKDFRNEEYKYPYFFDDIPSISNMDKIIEHFLSFEWGEFNHLSYDINFRNIKEVTDIDLWNSEFDKTTGVSFYQGKSNLIVVTHQTLFNEKLYENFTTLIKNKLKFNNLSIDTFSYKNEDTYGNLYEEFKKRIPKSFYEKYAEFDNKIINKFEN
jgi:hypothetical protein